MTSDEPSSIVPAVPCSLVLPSGAASNLQLALTELRLGNYEKDRIGSLVAGGTFDCACLPDSPVITSADISKNVIIIRFDKGEHEFVEHKLRKIEGVSEPDASYGFLKLWNIATTADWSVNSVILTAVHNTEAGQPVEFTREVAELLFEGLQKITDPDVRRGINAKVAAAFMDVPQIAPPTQSTLSRE